MVALGVRHMEHGTQAKDMWQCLVTSREPGRQLPAPSPLGSLQEAHLGPDTSARVRSWARRLQRAAAHAGGPEVVESPSPGPPGEGSCWSSLGEGSGAIAPSPDWLTEGAAR